MNRTEHLLACLAEECAEVSQRVTKALRFGLSEVQSGQAQTNAERIAVELADLIAVAEMLEEQGVIDRRSFSIRMFEAKKARVQQWMEYAASMGALK